MDVKESERKVVAKPVASRPSCSSVRTFTDLLADSVTVSPQSNCHETVDASIIPKTERFKQPASASVSSPRVEGSGDVKSCDDSESKSYVIYKPKAKLVSQATVSALANMLPGNCQQAWIKREAVAYGKRVNQGTHRAVPNLVPRVPTFKESETSTGDRSYVDGYNWRKYGQKQVKGSDSPRGYYKCTHPKCPVKKSVERSSMGGHVSEIVYQGFQTPSEGSMGEEPNPLWSNQEKMNEGCVITPFEFAVPRTANSTGGTSDSGCRSSQCDERELDDPSRSKTSMKNETQSSEAGVSQSSGESDSLEDGFKWRKYGQKAVGGNAYPRSYYRCTSVNCRARKRVERANDDPKAFITTYEGKHNHHHLQLRPPTSSTLPFSSPQHSNQAI
ncbi:WRKY transcription factor 44-like isoform X2 [Brassica rapa]|uniref:WRKY transcription factor 44-like isoform X2 n=1 Tax=Brassica campestris TaxID=3711 RepID=UPI0004F1AB9D|nr:WRKY transcription factor 44-like isoform X2 [Brassica rapa]